MRTRSRRSDQVNPATRATTTDESTAADAAMNGSVTATDSNIAAVIPVTSSSLVPPYVRDVSHSALVKWKRERREYEDAVGARCAATGEDKTKALRSVKNAFDWKLLETLCKFEWGTTVEAVTDERIVAELDKIIGNMMNDTIVNVDSIFEKELKMDLREPDVKARVINYFMKCNEIIMEHGLTSTFSTKAGTKEKCKLIKRHLEPAALRDSIDEHHRLVDASSKTDEMKLYQLVKDKALEQEKMFQLLAKRKQRQPRQTADHTGRKLKRDGEKFSRPGSSRPSVSGDQRTDMQQHRTVMKPNR